MSSPSSPTLASEGNQLQIRVPMQLRRRSGRTQIVIPDAYEPRAPRPIRSQDPIIVALVRAHRWRQLLESRAFAGISALADALGVDASYVGRHLNLTLLAPDIVETILLGKAPNGLSLEKLLHPPLSWGEQRTVLGFTESSRPLSSGHTNRV